MSTGYECRFYEPKPAEWFYLLQNASCPVGAWDWREDATCYGPFPTEEAALAHLDRNHANPGGWSTKPYGPGWTPDVVLAAHFAQARARSGRPATGTVTSQALAGTCPNGHARCLLARCWVGPGTPRRPRRRAKRA